MSSACEPGPGTKLLPLDCVALLASSLGLGWGGWGIAVMYLVQPLGEAYCQEWTWPPDHELTPLGWNWPAPEAPGAKQGYIFGWFCLPWGLMGVAGRWNWSSPGTLGQPPLGQVTLVQGSMPCWSNHASHMSKYFATSNILGPKATLVQMGMVQMSNGVKLSYQMTHNTSVEGVFDVLFGVHWPLKGTMAVGKYWKEFDPRVLLKMSKCLFKPIQMGVDWERVKQSIVTVPQKRCWTRLV